MINVYPLGVVSLTAKQMIDMLGIVAELCSLNQNSKKLIIGCHGLDEPDVGSLFWSPY